VKDLKIGVDGGDLPIVSWVEPRNLLSPEAGREARVECRIMRKAEGGQLLFVARGSVRRGQFEQGLPWQLLTGFSRERADARYYSGASRAVLELIGQRGQAMRALLSDTAHVIIAEFGGEDRIDINCADASEVEIEELQRTLRQLFVDSKPDHMDRLRKMKLNWAWPADDGKVLTYDPARKNWAGKAAAGGEAIRVIVATLVIAALMFGFVLWQIGVF
jgi:hypothetical protein